MARVPRCRLLVPAIPNEKWSTRCAVFHLEQLVGSSENRSCGKNLCGDIRLCIFVTWLTSLADARSSRRSTEADSSACRHERSADYPQASERRRILRLIGPPKRSI